MGRVGDVKVTVLIGAPGVLGGLVSTIGVPLRRPSTNEVEFSVDPAIGVKEDTNFDSGTEAAAGSAAMAWGWLSAARIRNAKPT